MASNQPQSEARNEHKQQKKKRRSRRFIPPIHNLAIVSILIGAVVALQVFNNRIDLLPSIDSAFVNILSLVFTFIACCFVAGWFVFRSAYSLVARWGIALVVIGLIAALIAALKVEHVSGNMVPRLSLRWAPRPDELLDHPAFTTGDADLLTRTTDDFPQFLGPQRNATLTHIKLSSDWRDRPPKQLWRRAIGAGWSAFSVVNGFAVTMEQRGDQEMVTCYEVLTGKMRWWHAVKARHATVLGGVGPRSTPTIHNGKVYALGATGVLRCLDGRNGDLVWRRDLLEQFGVKGPQQDLERVAWGRASSPLVVDDVVVVPAGGPSAGKCVSLAAFHQETGEIVWQAGDQQVSYSSPMLAMLGGQRQIVLLSESVIAGHSLSAADAADPSTVGGVVWSFDWAGQSNAAANVSQPVALSGDRIFLSKGYGGGAGLYQLTSDNQDTLRVQEIWRSQTVLKTKFTNVVIRENFVYGLSDGILECVDLRTGERQWKRGRYGHGQLLLVGNLILVQAESGEVALVQATPKRFTELTSFQALEGKTWNNPCLYGCYLLVRNAQEAACFQLAVIDESSSEPSIDSTE